jgi:CelD/BcsL family acetyltransferase involved in cellulose biosynthesis
MFNSICTSPLEKYSPGIALMHSMIGDAIERGCTELDFGVGEATYKTRFCTETDRLRDGIRGVSPVGRLAAVVIRTKLSAKRQIKTVPWLRALMEGARRRQGTSAAPAADADED